MKKITLLLSAGIFCFSFTNAQIINTIAGNGVQGFSGDGGSALAAEIDYPAGVGVDTAMNLTHGMVYFTTATDNRVRMVTTSGIIATYAGNGATGYTGDGGPATSAELNYPTGITVDGVGNVYISDYGNSVVRLVNTSGIITTFAGNGTTTFSGDGGPATSAGLNFPSSTALDAGGNIYIADNLNNCIRKVNSLGIISTIAGNTTSGYSGDGGQATAAALNNPWGVAADASGNIYIGDQYNYVVRKVNASGIISTIAGNHIQGNSGDGGQATAAEFSYTAYVATDAGGNVYISDEGNSRVRKVNNAGIINTIAGGGSSGLGDGGPATSAQLSGQYGLAFDATGSLYIADHGFARIRKVDSISCSNQFDEPICIATIDTSNNKCEVIWGRTNSPPDTANSSYNIYRDSSSVFYLINNQHLNNLSEYIDMSSNPSAGPVSYELSTVDSCGESALSSPHTTIFLTTTSALNVYILNWTAYVGFTPSLYRIFRGPALNSMVQIDSVANTVLTFHDTLPPLGSYYAVEAVNPSGTCIPTAKIRTRSAESVNLSGSFSNGFNTGILTGINQLSAVNNQLSVYPNPNNGMFTIVETQNIASVLWSVGVYNELGQRVYNEIGSGKINEQINLSYLADGVYTLRLITEGGISVQKVVVMKK